MESLEEKTRYIMKKYGITANKSLGQNFLINEDVVNNIVDSSEISKDDLVIEIGPGLGTLTESLLENAGKVVAIELDERMIKILNDRFFMYNNFQIINEDVLKVDLAKLIREQKEKHSLKNAKIVANLPYYITTPIIMKLLEEELDIESITVMIQKEVADRLIAVPGEKLSGAITYSVYYYAESESIINNADTIWNNDVLIIAIIAKQKITCYVKAFFIHQVHATISKISTRNCFHRFRKFHAFRTDIKCSDIEESYTIRNDDMFIIP